MKILVNEMFKLEEQFRNYIATSSSQEKNRENCALQCIQSYLKFWVSLKGSILVHLGWDDKTLQSMLLDLEEQNTIKRVGYYENRIVLMKYLKPWLLGINKPNTFCIPNPWITFDLEIRYDILLNWAGVIMNKVFECPGCSIVFLSEHTEYLSTRSIQEICMFLEKCECVKLKNIELREVDLFSDDDYVPEVTDFNTYDSPYHMLVFPAKNCLTKYSYIRKKILDMSEAD